MPQLRNLWCGALTSTSVQIVVRVTANTFVRVWTSTNSDMSGAQFHPWGATSLTTAKVTVSGLQPDTQYYYELEVESTTYPESRGKFRTLPTEGQPASFKFAAGACAGSSPEVPGVDTVRARQRLSNSPVFDAVREQDPLFFFHAGDLHYYDLGSGLHGLTTSYALTWYRNAYDDVLMQPRQAELYRNVPLVYAWDDHDFGPNDSDRTHGGNANANQAYRQRVPHYPLPNNPGIFHSFVVGRVLFIVADVRTFRDPNSDPMVPSKTMLGTAQKEWMDQLLASTSAEVVCWMQSDQWTRPTTRSHPGADTWASFPHERDEIVDMFRSHGFGDRTFVVQGDYHSNGIAYASNPRARGLTTWQCGPLDSSPSGELGLSMDVDFSGLRSQFGVFDVVDTGDTLSVAGSLTLMGDVQSTHTVTFVGDGEEAPPPDVVLPPEPSPFAPVQLASATPGVSWLGCDLVSGRIIADLPDMETGSISRALASYTSDGQTLPIPLSGPGSLGYAALQATQPGRTMLVAVINDVPAWAGLVIARKGGTDAVLQLSCVTPEGYLDRRTVGDHELEGVDQARIASLLADDAESRYGVGQGLGLAHDVPLSGVLRSRTYLRSDRVSVLRRLIELTEVDGGPEWTIDLDWVDPTQTAVRKIFRVRDRIGTAMPYPPVFDSTTSRYELDESFADGRGANWVEAFAAGEGDDQPASDYMIDIGALNDGWPIFERHYQPSLSSVSDQVLNEHAAAELARLRRGSHTWAIEAKANTYPRFGVDWGLGDTVAFALAGHRHPDGVTGQGRVIGWSLNIGSQTIRPVLVEEEP